MPEWKILITDGLDGEGQNLLRSQAEVVDRSGISAEELLAEIEPFHALIVRGRTKVTKQLLAAAPDLKVVGRAGVGVDNIDLAAAQSRNVAVVNAPTASSEAVAELSMALMLALIRHIPQADAAMKSGQWIKKQLNGLELSGKTLGIIGLGRIGSGVALRAAAFGMHVIAHDPLLQPAEIAARGAESVSLPDLYARSDFISLHLPLTPETRRLLDGEAFAAMKRGVYIICAARGGVIDETALHARLESGQVAGAALDVFAQEPPGLTALVAHPNVIATPHIGAQTVEAQRRAAEHIAGQVLAALNGQPLSSQVV